MKCMSCSADVPPEWVSAISRNCCPSCGNPIMDDTSKELLDELKGAMEKMPNNPEGLAGWLLTNYKLTKVGSAEPTTFFTKQNDLTAQQIQQIKIRENPATQFLQRTGMAERITSRKSLQQIAEEINAKANQDDLEVNDQPQDYPDDPIDNGIPIPAGPANALSARTLLANNSLVVPDENLAPPSIEELRAIRNMTAATSDGLPPPVVTMHGQVVDLQTDRMVRLEKQRAVASGAGISIGGKAGCSIRRSG